MAPDHGTLATCARTVPLPSTGARSELSKYNGNAATAQQLAIRNCAWRPETCSSFNKRLLVMFSKVCERAEPSAATSPASEKSKSEADARATPNTVGIKLAYTIAGKYCPCMDIRQTVKTGMPLLQT
mmetsp:Transcript_19331/g.58097  ORF Transcript_19331/g.58097 Transcript_19331/m.58097 type:complete len:127 (-) Transcript_19331:496-876(-)